MSVTRGSRELGTRRHEKDRKGDTHLSGFAPTVFDMTDNRTRIDEFFDRYASALLNRDAAAIAELYAIPGLILFPSNSIAVNDPQQTQEFFASSWDQYEGVDDVDHTFTVIAQAPSSTWVDLTWSYGGEPRERFCYQLVETNDGLQIAVLTPM